MLFQINIPTDVRNYSLDEKRLYLRSLENLLRARLERKHIIHMCPEDISRIKQLGRVSQDAADVLAWIMPRFSEIEGLRKAVACYTTLEPRIARRIDETGSQRIIYEDLREFADSAYAQKSILICENKKDSAFFEYVAKVLAHKMGQKTLGTALDVRGGGGTGIADEYAQQVSQGYIILAVADSDRMCGCQPIGPTSPAGLLEQVTAIRGYQLAIHLNSRNIENVVSDDLWWSALERPHAKECRTNFDFYYKNLHDTEWRKYSQFKDSGQLLYDIRNLAPASDCGKRWVQYATTLGRVMCKNPTTCRKKEECKCKVLIGLGQNAHKKVTDWLKKNFRSARDSAPLFDWSLKVEPQVAAMVLAWGCTDGRSID